MGGFNHGNLAWCFFSFCLL